MQNLTETWRGDVSWLQLPQDSTQSEVAGEEGNESTNSINGKESRDQFEELSATEHGINYEYSCSL